ncbi:MAG: hypothetical protein KC448_06825 [Yoonia sp.]|nr:hypothetical protein [Yoonia sp.]
MAWNIVRHAFLMIFNNFGQAVRVTVGPGLLLLLAWLAFFSLAGMPLDGDPDLNALSGGGSTLVVLLIIPLLAFSFFVAGWVAVAWHRFILLEEYTGLLPATAGRPIWGYIGKSILLGLLLSLAAIPVTMIAGLVSAPFMQMTGGPSLIVFAIFGLIIGTFIGFLWFRTAICLPAKALGEDMKFAEAWAKTRDISGTLFGVTLIIVGLNIGAALVLGVILNGVPLVSSIVELAINWLSTMVGISVLTTIYGHSVQGRPLTGT